MTLTTGDCGVCGFDLTAHTQNDILACASDADLAAGIDAQPAPAPDAPAELPFDDRGIKEAPTGKGRVRYWQPRKGDIAFGCGFEITQALTKRQLTLHPYKVRRTQTGQVLAVSQELAGAVRAVRDLAALTNAT